MSNKKLLIILIAAGLILVVFSVSRNNNAHKETESISEVVSENTVAIKEYRYFPKNIKVKKGTTVTWENFDLVPHTVTKSEGEKVGPDSNYFAKGGKYSYTFSKPGKYDYYCKPHPYMKGTVEVIE